MAALSAAAGESRVAATSLASAGEWSARVEHLLAARALAVRQVREDRMIPGRTHERLAQLHRGVPVFGAELVRQSDVTRTLTVFGTLYDDITLDVAPRLAPRDVERLLADRGGQAFGSEGGPELVVLPLDGSYRLVYRVRASFAAPFDLRQLFFDAASGAVVREYRDVHAQAAGLGTGVLGDLKKLSVAQAGAGWTTSDRLRPPLISTYDFRFDVARLIRYLIDGRFQPADLAADADNVWTDGAVVDAHATTGLVYDFLYQRFGRRGLDDANIPIHSITHALRREDFVQYSVEDVGTLFANAFYLGDGVMYYGDGLPPGVSFAGRQWNYLAGGLDVVAHELTHGVTDYTSRLIYDGQSGALNESFSDVMATACEFYAQPGRADYLIAEDVVTPGGLRSLQNPASYGDPDFLLDFHPNRGVHSNSAIPSLAFYLAIEGGQHRGRSVQGVGAANRQQIERVWYRAFTSFLTPSATLSHARAATIQAARELYGGDPRVEQAVTQGWAAVGVIASPPPGF